MAREPKGCAPLLVAGCVIVATAGSVAPAKDPAKAAKPAVLAPLKDLPANKWVTVYDGPPGIITVHARLLWLEDMHRGLIWPNYNYRTRRWDFQQHALLHFYQPDEGKWTAVASTFPKGLTVTPEMVGLSYTYLRGIKRVLVLQLGTNRRRKVRVRSWLLDPRQRRWEALLDQPRMHDLSSDFNPARGADGADIPLWGGLVYAAGTGEAVCIGGGGTWGRVGKEPEPVQPGDWFYDETARPKRIRRFTQDDRVKVSRARKWYPANCGTWTFSEAERKWRPIAQPLGSQPSGRVLPGAAYDAKADKIVMFGGDDLQRCLRDTWIYDCKRRTWQQVRPKVSPPARAG